MSHPIHISDALYARIAAFAAQCGQEVDRTAETLLEQSITEIEPSDVEIDDDFDPLAEFLGAFDSSGLPPLDPREHDLYFAGKDLNAQKND